MATSTLPRRARLTKRTVEALPTPATEVIIWDDQLPGFGLRLLPTGVRTWVLQRRLTSGRSVKLKLGRLGDLSAYQARAEAERLIAEITLGKDPAAERRAARRQERERKTAPTLAELLEAWAQDRRPHWRDRTVFEVDRLLERYVLPALGARRAAEITYGDVRKLHVALSASAPVMANRVTAWLKAAFAWGLHPERAADWGLATNPAVGIAANTEEKRHRFPTNGELERLVAALHARGDLAARFYLLLLLTGARRGELEGAKWQDFDLEAGIWVKPASATKQKRLHRLPLSPEAVAILREVKASNPFQPFLVDEWRLRQAWSEILAAANIEDLRVHDLRHFNAALLAKAGFSLPVIGSMLGHSSAATTQRYTALVDEVQREAAERIGRLINFPARSA